MVLIFSTAALFMQILLNYNNFIILFVITVLLLWLLEQFKHLWVKVHSKPPLSVFQPDNRWVKVQQQSPELHSNKQRNLDFVSGV